MQNLDMEYICILLLLSISIISYMYMPKIYNVSFLFSFFWCVILFLANLHCYDIYPPSTVAYCYITLGVVSYTVGFFIVMYRKSYCLSNIFDTEDNHISGQRYVMIFLLCIVLLLPDLKMIYYFFHNGMDLHYIYYVVAMNSGGAVTEISDIQFGSGWQEIIKIYVGYTLQYILIMGAICKITYDHEKIYYIPMFALMIVRFLIDVKRTILVMTFFSFIYMFILTKDMRNSDVKLENKVFSKKLLLYVSVFIASYIILSSMRVGYDGDEFSIFKNFYFYYVGCVKYFDLRLAAFPDDISSYTFGLFALRGLLSPFLSFVTKVFEIEVPLYANASKALESLHGTVMMIAPGHDYNSYATAFYEFYVDGGLVGICVESCIFGCVSGYLLMRYLSTHTLLSAMRLSFFISVYILFSMLQISSIISYLVWSVVFCFILYKRKIDRV